MKLSARRQLVSAGWDYGHIPGPEGPPEKQQGRGRTTTSTPADPLTRKEAAAQDGS